MTDNGTTKQDPDQPPIHTTTIIERRSGSGLILGIIAIALILAIGFFYVESERREREGDAVVGAAQSVGDAARDVGDAAKDAANKLKNDS